MRIERKNIFDLNPSRLRQKNGVRHTIRADYSENKSVDRTIHADYGKNNRVRHTIRADCSKNNSVPRAIRADYGENTILCANPMRTVRKKNPPSA